jgi:hypothetical protein
MTIAQPPITVSDQASASLQTRAAEDDLLVSKTEAQQHRDGWDRIIDRYLIEWGRDPSSLQEDGMTAPTPEILALAIRVARDLQRQDPPAPAPLRVVLDGEGGVSFERRDNSWLLTLNVLADRTIEWAAFKDCRLQGKHRIL